MFVTKNIFNAFAIHRNNELSFSFLKENGELLSIIASRGMLVENGAIQSYKKFYDNSHAIVEFFPQYYRFILAMVLDLEDLGMKGSNGLEICNFVQSQNLIDFDTSDTRRLECFTLLERRIEIEASDPVLIENAHKMIARFVADPQKFSRYNKPLFYEFTHLIFFLTRYGTSSPSLDADLIACTMNGGRLAYLDQDTDLLAEFCVCLNYLKAPVPRPWIVMLEQALNDIEIFYDQDVASALNPSVDDYHPYLVINWALSFERSDCFSHRFQSGTPRFKMQYPENTILSRWSERLFEIEVEGKADTSEDNWGADMLDQRQTGWLNSGLDADPGMAETIQFFSNGLITL